MKSFTFFLGASILVSTNIAAAEKPFTLKEGLRLRMPVERTNSDITRDGALVAIAMSSEENQVRPGPFNLTETGATIEAGGEIWICDTAKEKIWRISDDNEFAFGPRWSPDSSKLAYYSDRDGKVRLWIWDRATQQSRLACDRIVRTTYGFELPEWSPNGDAVFFKSLSQEFEAYYNKSNSNWYFAPFKPRRQKSDAKVTANESVVMVQGTPISNDAKDVQPTQGATIGSVHGIYDLVRYDLSTNSVANILPGIPMRDFDLSPDGEWVVATTIVGDEDAARFQVLHRCLAASTHVDKKQKESAEPRVLVPAYRESYGISTSWAPDSKSVAFITSGPDSAGDLKVVDFKSGDIKNLTAKFDTKLTGEENEQRALWNSAGTHLYFPIDGDLWEFLVDEGEPKNLTADYAPRVQGVITESQSTVVWDLQGKLLCEYSDRETDEVGFCFIDPKGNSVHEVRRERKRYGWHPRFSVDVVPDTGEILFRASDATSPFAAYLASQDFSSVLRLPTPNDWLSNFDMGRMEVVEWKLGDDQNRGLLLLPSTADANTPPPCIVCVYPGESRSRQIADFRLSLIIGGADNANPRFFFERGFAVFIPDLPETKGEPLRDIWQSLEPAIDALEKTKLVNSDRLGLIGQSYGGYAVNTIIASTDRFGAAVSSSGMSNLVSSYLRSAGNHGSTSWYEDGQLGIRVSIAEDPDRFARNSPVYHLKKINTPLLLIHGEDDPQHHQAVEMFGGLRRAGKTAQLATYPGAGHAFGSFAREQVEDFWERVLAWYEEHLKVDE